MRRCFESVLLPALLLLLWTGSQAVRPDGSADCQEDNGWCGQDGCDARNGWCGHDWESAKAGLATEDRSLEALARRVDNTYTSQLTVEAEASSHAPNDRQAGA